MAGCNTTYGLDVFDIVEAETVSRPIEGEPANRIFNVKLRSHEQVR